MNQRLLWNFEFAPARIPLSLSNLVEQQSDPQKWELRFFWPSDEIVVLNAIDNSLLDMANYQKKHREDYYFLLPKSNYNIKLRRNELLYKPVLKKAKQAVGFGAKISIESITEHTKSTSPADPQLHELVHQVRQEGMKVYVKKEAFIYKFPTTPTIKLELARIEVQDKTYLSACIEGKSLDLVETIGAHLLDKHISCEYVTFLKKILHL